jgi:uncharacterized protein YegJ (DUF2314 family)
MRRPSLVMLLGLAGLLCSSQGLSQSPLEKSRRDEISRMDSEDPAMARAFRKARTSLDDFLALAKAPPPNTQTYALKVAVSDSKDKGTSGYRLSHTMAPCSAAA